MRRAVHVDTRGGVTGFERKGRHGAQTSRARQPVLLLVDVGPAGALAGARVARDYGDVITVGAGPAIHVALCARATRHDLSCGRLRQPQSACVARLYPVVGQLSCCVRPNAFGARHRARSHWLRLPGRGDQVRRQEVGDETEQQDAHEDDVLDACAAAARTRITTVAQCARKLSHRARTRRRRRRRRRMHTHTCLLTADAGVHGRSSPREVGSLASVGAPPGNVAITALSPDSTEMSSQSNLRSDLPGIEPVPSSP